MLLITSDGQNSNAFCRTLRALVDLSKKKLLVFSLDWGVQLLYVLYWPPVNVF